MFTLIAKILNALYGYEGINILFRMLPSRYIISILSYFGANIGNGIRIKTPFIIHNADQKSPIFSNLRIGDDCYIGRDCIFDLMGKITIGKKVTISHRVLLNTHTNAGNSPITSGPLIISSGHIEINDGAYLGSNTTILENVKIGQETIIGSKSLVNKNIPDRVTAFGIPCKVNKEHKNDN
ncbi:MAG: acyltransferase [Candidatus Neomarinimicrobiota bacterium]